MSKQEFEQINAEVLAKCDELEAEIVAKYDLLGEHLKKKLAEIHRIRRMFEGRQHYEEESS